MSEAFLNETQQEFLLKLARDAIIHYLNTKKHIQVKPDDPTLEEKRGAFVTLKNDEKLRGCIGYPLPTDPLYTTIIDTAILAASKDHRFQPLTKEELPDTRIEISVLSLPKAIKDISEIQVGKHGIIITQGMSKGLLLPQVPGEWNWDLETYLRHGCMKAGIKENAWKKDAQVEIFSAQVFSD